MTDAAQRANVGFVEVRKYGGCRNAVCLSVNERAPFAHILARTYR